MMLDREIERLKPRNDWDLEAKGMSIQVNDRFEFL